jgi:molybdopterin-guanine dinucleotide biosynthesis protein B
VRGALVRGRRRVSRAPILAFSGPSGVGKTTLLVSLIAALRARGITVAALKHSGHRHPFDVPGKDSARLRAAGAVAVAVSGPHEIAYFGPPVADLAALAGMLPPADVVLAESFKGESVPRVEVHREAVSREFLCARDRRVIAVVSDAPPPRPLPCFAAGEVERLADFVARFARAGRRGRRRALASAGERDQRHAEAVHPRETRMATKTAKRSGGARAKAAGTRRTTAKRGAAKRGGATVREAGRKGGKRTLARRGPEFYARIGRKGGKSSGTARGTKRTARAGAAKRAGRAKKA